MKGDFVKKLLYLFLIIIIGAVGLFVYRTNELKKEYEYYKSQKVYTTEEKKDLALEYMKEKYKEEFVGVSYGLAGASIFNSYDHFKVYPKRLTENDLIYITGRYNDRGEYVFRDSYFEILIEDRYREYVGNLLDELYPEYFLKINGRMAVQFERSLPDRLTKDIPINEIYTPDETFFSPLIYVYISQSQLNQKNIADHAHMIANKFLEHNLNCTIYLYVVKQEKYMECKQKEGDIYPEDLDEFSLTWEIEKKFNDEFFITEENMQREFYEVIIRSDGEKGNLEISLGIFNK